jgi:hypothetical protein
LRRGQPGKANETNNRGKHTFHSEDLINPVIPLKQIRQ